MKHIVTLCAHLVLVLSCTYLESKLIPVAPLYRKNRDSLQSEQTINDFTHMCIIINSFDDTILALRLAPILHKRGKQICVQADASLQPLLSMSNFITPREEMETVTHVCVIDELIPLLYDTCDDMEDFSYINLDPLLMEIWHDAFTLHTLCRVGLCLTQRSGNHTLLRQQISIADFIPCALLRTIELFTFDPITNVKTQENVTLYYFPTQVRMQAQHLAAILNELDVLITTCPSMAALAWMLNKKVWLIQPATILTQAYLDCYPGIEILHYTNNDTSSLLSNIIERLAHLEIATPREKIITAEVQIGELIDKMTILEIKTERIDDAKKLANVWRELATIRATFEQHIPQSPELEKLIQELKAANETMWQTEDRIRDKEREKCFDDEFIRLARAIYMQNDERCRVKRVINELLGSRLIEEKSYKPY